MTVDLPKLYIAYRENEAAADAKYLNRRVQFTFAPVGIDKEDLGEYCAWSNLLGFSDPALFGRHYKCHFNARQAATLARFKPGQTLTVRGVCVGKTGMVRSSNGYRGQYGGWSSDPVIDFKDCELIGKPTKRPVSNPTEPNGSQQNRLPAKPIPDVAGRAEKSPQKPVGKVRDKPFEAEKPLELADVVLQEYRRRVAARLLDPTGLIERNQLPPLTIPDPYAELRALALAQASERKAVHRKTVEGAAVFLGARLNAGGTWIVSLQLPLPDQRQSGLAVGIYAFATHDAVAILRSVKVRQRVKVRGKVRDLHPYYRRENFLSLVACTFADGPPKGRR